MVAMLQILDPGQKNAGVANDGAAGLDDDRQTTAATNQHLDHSAGISFGVRRIFVSIINTEPTPDVEMLEFDTMAGQLTYKIDYLLESIDKDR